MRSHGVGAPALSSRQVPYRRLLASTGVSTPPPLPVSKRAMDLVLAAWGLLLSLPFFAVIALLIKADSNGPIIFRQVRVGAGGRVFQIYKFRTMVSNAEDLKPLLAQLSVHEGRDPRMFKVSNDPRTTRVGRFLRRYALDELPQLMNVLKGDMSLVGPRPLIPDEDRHIRGRARKRLELRPGITGLWQVRRRSKLLEELMTLDYIYVTNWSLARDLQILMETPPAVFSQRRRL
jgi:lipopolysaccharide/colanic/teichoic acid biosynthesis glycosyltransferase